MDNVSDSYNGFLLEELSEQLKFVIEALKALKYVPAELRKINKRLDRMNERLDVVEPVAKDNSQTLNNHELRITKLETS